MFIINEKNNKMILTKGDNATFGVSVNQVNGTTVDTQNALYTFTVRKTPDAADALISKTCSDGKFALLPNDTKSLNPDLYCYDILFKDKYNNISTIIPNSFFELRQEISR